MKNICVFMSANDLPKKYTKPAIKLAELLVSNGYNLVYGGSDYGLMKVVDSTIQKSGGKTIGVTMELIKDRRKKDATEMTIAGELSERKRLLLEKSDAVVVLVGGIGTLDEVTEVLELKKHQVHDKPIIFMNTENFYQGLKMQLIRMEEEGFLIQKLDQLLHFADTPEDVIDYLKSL